MNLAADRVDARARFRAAHGFTPRTCSLAEAEQLEADLEEQLVSAVSALADTERSILSGAHVTAAQAMGAMQQSTHPSRVVGLGGENLDRLGDELQQIVDAHHRLHGMRALWSSASLEASCWRDEVQP